MATHSPGVGAGFESSPAELTKEAAAGGGKPRFYEGRVQAERKLWRKSR